MPGWLDPSATRVRLKEAQEEEARAQEAAEQEALAREIAELREANARVRIMLADVKFELALRAVGRKYSPDQPRVSAGNPDGGQWAKEGGGDATRNSGGRNDPRIISDTALDGGPGAQYATNRPRAPIIVRIAGRTFQLEGGQAARFAEAQSRADIGIARVRELDRNWKPTPSFNDTIEGQIAAYRAEAREAEGRLAELSNVGIGPGAYAGESIPARGPERRYDEREREEVRRMFDQFGCHTCGRREAGTPSGNPILDHQYPSALNPPGRPQLLFPQCAHCSAVQGGWVRSLMRPR